MDGNFGLGVDIEGIDRFVRLARNSRLLARVFTAGELDYCLSKKTPAPHLAARFAAKEAVIKALSSLGREKPRYRDVEVTVSGSGAPGVRINRVGFQDILFRISLSHDRDKAIAFVMAVRPTH